VCNLRRVICRLEFHRDVSHPRCFFLCLSMIFVLVFVFQSFISFIFFYFIIIYYISIVLDCGNADDLQINLSEDRKDLDEMISALRIWLRFLDGRLRMGCYLTPASRRKF
jgi:hypothetical protein